MLKLIAVLVLFVAVPVLAEDESQAGMIAVGVGNWEPPLAGHAGTPEVAPISRLP